MSHELSVHSFTDYRTYLVAHAQNMKKRTPTWSYGSWARTLGLKNTSSITKVLQGSRNPGAKMTEKFVRYFKLENAEADYFRDLVQLRKVATDSRLSVLLQERMSRSHPRGAVRILDDKTFSLISGWYHLPLREYVRMHGDLEDADVIAEQFRFKVTPREIKAALQTLLELGLLKRADSGRLEVAENTIDTTSDVASEAIKRYHEQMLDHAKDAVRSVSLEERELTAASLNVRLADLPKAKEMIRDFRREFTRAFEAADGDAVYQIQVQLFPITKRDLS